MSEVTVFRAIEMTIQRRAKRVVIRNDGEIIYDFVISRDVDKRLWQSVKSDKNYYSDVTFFYY